MHDRTRLRVGETTLGDWTLERDSDSRTDTVLLGDTLIRVGLTDTIAAQVGWTPYGHVRMRDATSEAQVLRDDDPDDKTTQALGALSLGWMAGKTVQIDIGGAAGLNRDAPDAGLYVGVSRLF